MSQLDQIKNSFTQKLDNRRAAHSHQLQQELHEMRTSLLTQPRPALPPDVLENMAACDRWLASRLKRGAAARPAGVQLPVAASAVEKQVNLARVAVLEKLDQDFARLFDLRTYFPISRLDYPTVFCETLEEFFSAILQDADLSAEARQAALEQMVGEAKEQAKKGGTYGVNIPGRGCYLNGWLLAQNQPVTPLQALSIPSVMQHTLMVAAHEKLGHGFLSAYSALGQAKARLGSTLIEIASQFGLRQADDPISALRRDQANLLGFTSQLVEEGWATWIESYIAANLLEVGQHPRHSHLMIVEAITRLPKQIEEVERIRELLMYAMHTLFLKENASMEELLDGVRIITLVGGGLDDYFGHALGQPLRYAVGELLMAQAEANLGAGAVPYAALIAANVTIDPSQVSLADLRELFSRDPRLNADARLAALCCLKLQEPGSVRELAQQAASVYSFSIPPELR
ncbi:MAG: hypothetical protein MUC85_01930 [Anaerolineales bacterium]|jgi:hypothetical protein|nr:hypothetical protein [Anaerolineales bacterium]